MIMKTLYTTYNNFAKRMVMSLMVLMTVGVGSVLGETVTFNPSDFSGQGTSGTGSSISATKDGVTFSCNKGSGTTQFRCYKGGKITISSSQTITAISFTCSANDYWGGLSDSYTGLNTSSWEFTTSGQARITSCTVTYTTSGGGDDDDSGCITLSTTQNYPFNSTSSSNTSVYATEIDGVTFENKGGYKYNSYLSFNKSLSGAYIANTTPFSGNIESIVVNYNSGGSAYFTMYEGSSSLPSSTIVSPSKTGTGEVTYTFSGNNAYFKFALTTTDTYCNISSITICCSTTPQTFTVTYNANGAESGDVPTDNQEYTSGASVTVLGNTGNLVKTGYRFDGWQINKSGTVYNAGSTFNISENTTLYAKWTARTLTNYRTSCGSAATLVSIAVSGQTTTYNVGDSFSFDGTCIATYDDESTKTVTPTSVSSPDMSTAGKKTVTVTYTEGDVTVTTEYDITVNVVKTATSLTWSADSYTATIASPSNLFPTLTINPEAIKGSVTYSSSHPEYATIDAAGNIRLLAAGTTTITASFAGNGTYAPAEDASYTLTVVESNCRWVETEIGDITFGDDVLITVPGTDGYGNPILNMLQDPKASTNPTIETMNVSDLLNGANVDATLIWNIRKRDDNQDNFTIYRNGSTTDRLAFITNYGVRVGGNNADSIFTLTPEKYLKSIATQEYLRMATSDWRHYSTNTTQTLKLYKRICLDATNYWVTWDAGEGTWTDGSSNKLESYQVGATITAPTENPTREGYRFDGWTPAPNTMPAENTTFTAQWTEVYKITWYENGVPSYTYVPSDNPIVTWEDNIADCGEKKFYGWTADNTFVSHATTPPACIEKGITIDGDVTYYAVYADATVPANPGYEKVTTISEGTYLIATDAETGKAYTGKSGDNPYGGYCDVEKIENDVISEKPDAAVEVIVTLDGSNFYMHDGTYYLGYMGSSNNMSFDTSIQDGNKNIWKLTTEGHIESVNVSGRILQYNSGSPRFACYSTNQKKAYLYKKQTTTYTNFAVSCATYAITITPPAGGTVTTTPADEAGAGQTITVNVTPADCKYLTALKYNDGSDHNINIASTPYTFTMPAADVTVTATFADKTATDIEILTSAHRNLMQGSAFVGEQIKVTYDNGETETLDWDDTRLTFSGYNMATLGTYTVRVDYNDCGTANTSYSIEVIDGIAITFIDAGISETIKYELNAHVDVETKTGQYACSGHEFVGWSETEFPLSDVPNMRTSEEYVPVRNFNATTSRTFYAVYSILKKQGWVSIEDANHIRSGAEYMIVKNRYDTYSALSTTTSTYNANYRAATILDKDEDEDDSTGNMIVWRRTSDNTDFQIYTGTATNDVKWLLIKKDNKNYLYNQTEKKYLQVTTTAIPLTSEMADNFKITNESGDCCLNIQSATSNYYISGYNSSNNYYFQPYSTETDANYLLTRDSLFTTTPPCSPLYATFYGNGGIVTDGIKSGDYLTIKEPTRDAGITTPTASFADCNGKTWTFVGWAREEIDVTRVPVLTTDLLHDGGGNKHYNIEKNGEEFWAVYTNQGTPETKYGTITFTKENFPNTYDNISKSCTIVENGDSYNFYYTNVAKPSSNSIQIQEGKGYLTNTTSLGKINSISFTNFIYGNINCLKVSLGTSADALTTVLTAEELQVVDGVYTYYPKANYSFFKIESIEDAGAVGIETISIDFGKGTQIWATTPDCSTITLSGDELYVTSTNGQSIRAMAKLTVKAVQLESKAKVVISSNSSDIYFSDVLDANFTQAVKPTETLTLTTDVDGNLSATEIYVHYRPSVDGTGIPEEVVVSANLETPNPSITDDHTIHVRNLPADFVIAAKWGDNWYAMPANMDSQSSTEGWLIEVDDPSNPTKAIAAPNTTKYGLKSVYTSNSTDDRFENYGERLVFVENVEESTPVANKTLYNGGGSGTSNTNIQVYAQYSGYYSTNPDRYEWIPTTTNMQDYTLTSAYQFTKDDATLENARTVGLDNHGEFGTLLQDKAYNGMVRLLPVDDFYAPAELQVVEWKQNSVSVMYTGAGTKYTTKVGDNTESSAQTLSAIDHAVYSLSTTDLTTATNQPLIITIKDDADAIIGAVKLTIPAIVAADKTTTELGVAEENAKATNIVILDGATLTAGTTKYTYNDVVVYPGGKLVIGQNGQLGMYSLTLRAGSAWGAAEYENKYPQLLVRGDYSNTSGQINLDYVTTQDYYYPLSVPEEVTIGDIKYPVDIYGSNVDKANTGSFRLKYYNGVQRATGATGWVVLDEKNITKLSPNSGYAFWGIPKKVSVNGAAGVRQTYGIHRIPIKIAADKLLDHEKKNEEITIQAYAAARPNDQGWNYLGNPYLVGLGSMDGSDDDLLIGLLEKEMVDGKWTGGWVYNEESVNNKVRYITITNDCQTFEAKPVAEAQIPSFTTFFIQAASVDDQKILLTAPASVLNVSSLPARHYAAQQETAKEITTGILLTGNDQTDRTGLLIADNFTEEYDFNADLSKFENSGINLYTIGKDGKLAFMAINQALAEQPIPLGYGAPADGEYTIAFDEDRYNATDISALYLIDYDRNEKTNLLHTDYSFVTTAGTNNERFALQVAFIPQNATSVEWVDDATIQVAVDGNNLLLNNLPTDAGVQVFDALGRVLYATLNAPTEMQITLPTGYYLVRIADKQHAVVINTVIP